MKEIKLLVERYLSRLLLLITTCISIIATAYFYFHGTENLSNYDAIARLDLARKMIDSITPGIGQLGAIWLPFPQIFTIPFIWNDFLWHSGLAGAIISGIAFIVGAFYLQKTAFLITRSRKASLLVWLIFVININILLFQSMAMSESFFLFCIIMTIYFLTKWMQDKKIVSYLAAAFFVMMGTLTRYEGYFIFIGASLTVFIRLFNLHWKKKNFAEIEGMVLLFLTIAVYGIFLWCLYSFIFFKDPLYWLHLYSGNGAGGSLVTPQAVRHPLWESLISYSQIAIWMNGILTSLLGIGGFVILLILILQKMKTREKISIYLPLLVITFVLFPLLIFGYEKGYIPHVTFEAITLQHIFSKKFNIYPGGVEDAPNIRYGIIMVPFVSLFVGIFAARARLLMYISLIFICFQFYTIFNTSLLLEFSIPRAARFTLVPAAIWFKSHYTNGLIFVSDNTNEDFMFETGLSYNHYIYEGTRQYWKTSLNNPSRYADWVVYQTKITGDLVYHLMSPSGFSILERKYQLVYSDNKGYKIYHRISF